MGIKIKKLKESVRPYQDADVLLIDAGNILEVRYQVTPMEPPIQKLSGETFVDKRTGEVREFNHDSESRQDNVYTVRKSMENLRRIINTNVTEPQNCRWLTLTYEENVTDTIRIYEDFKRFWPKLKRRAKRENWGSPDYISVVEPQARGAWHYHVILIFPKRAPYIDNKIIERMWGNGYTKIKKLNDSVDNIGAYLCAYLTDIPVEEAIGDNNVKGELKAVQASTEDGKKVSKAVIKGGRLKYYPNYTKLYRTSRGIKRPVAYHMTEKEAQEIIGDAPLTFEKTIEITDGDQHINTINYRHYNLSNLLKNGKGKRYGKEQET